MPAFAYTARDDSGAASNGTVVADSAAQAGQLLRGGGKYPISIRPADQEQAETESPSARGVRISRTELIQLATQLGIMVETGVTLSEALDCIAAQSETPEVRALVQDLAQQVQRGGDFSQALARHPRSFPRMFIVLMQASEKSGMLCRLLLRATAYLREEQEVLRRVKGALTYPAIMLGFAVTTTLFLLAFVLPRFTGIYASKGAVLPAPTRILMAASDLIVGNWMLLLAGLGSAAVIGALYVRTKGGQRLLHYVQLHLPLIGTILRKLHLSRGLRMVGTLAAAGVNLVDCVRTAHDLAGNSYYRELWNEVSEQIQAGKQLSATLFTNPLVPRSVAQMVHAGEKSGKVAAVMEQVATHAEQELKDKIAEMTRYIEPAMIVLMGLIVGGIALALLLPVFTISRVVGT